MKPKKLNPGLLWMQFEDVLAPRLGLSVKERAVYSYLLRHSLVVGKLRLQFAVMALARTLGLSIGAARQAVRADYIDSIGLFGTPAAISRRLHDYETVGIDEVVVELRKRDVADQLDDLRALGKALAL